MEREQEGIVIEANGSMAKVKTSRHSHCENCGSCPGNTAMILEARNPVNAKPGQRVAIEVREVNMLKAAFIVYMLPLLNAFIGAVAGTYLAEALKFETLLLSIVGGIVGFIVSLLYIKYFDRSARSNINMQPVITRILSE